MTTGDCLCMKRGGRPYFFNEEMYYKTSVLFYDNKKTLAYKCLKRENPYLRN